MNEKSDNVGARQAAPGKDSKPGTELKPAAKPIPKEATVSKKKRPFAELARRRKLTPARVAALKVCTGWDETTKITEVELEQAIQRHLKNTPVTQE